MKWPAALINGKCTNGRQNLRQRNHRRRRQAVVGPLLENAPTFSYAKIPEGMKDVPDYWKVLAAPVPPQQGMPHFRNIRISDVTAKGARQAFGVSAYPEATLRNFDFRNIDIEAKVLGTIQNTEDWTFANVTINENPLTAPK